MKFSAELRQGSYVDKRWKSERRLGGVLHGVAFRKVGQAFQSVNADLTADQVVDLQNHPDIVLSMNGDVGDIDVNDTPLNKAPAPKAPVTTQAPETAPEAPAADSASK